MAAGSVAAIAAEEFKKASSETTCSNGTTISVPLLIWLLSSWELTCFQLLPNWARCERAPANASRQLCFYACGYPDTGSLNYKHYRTRHILGFASKAVRVLELTASVTSHHENRHVPALMPCSILTPLAHILRKSVESQ